MRTDSYRDMYRREDTHFWFAGKQAFIRAALRYSHIRSARILDIGAGTGGTTKTLSRYGTVTGIEPNRLAAKLARSRGLHVLTQSASHLPFGDKSFDLVTIFDVLYHKGVQESKVLQEAFRVLKPNGILLITDCAVPWLYSSHDAAYSAKYRYSKSLLQSFVEKAGFRLDITRYIFSFTFPIFLITRLMTKHTQHATTIPTIHPLVNTILTKVLLWEASLFSWWNPPFGSSLLISARKIEHQDY